MVLLKRNFRLFWINLSYGLILGVLLVAAVASFVLHNYLTLFFASQNIALRHPLNIFGNKRMAAKLETPFEIESKSKEIQTNTNFVSTIIPQSKFIRTENMKEDRKSSKMCEVPKLTPGSKDVYDLDYEQFLDWPCKDLPSPCLRFLTNTSNANDPENTPTMFAIDFESNLVQLNTNHIFWNETKCFYKSKIKDLNETLYVENNSTDDESGEPITNDKTKLNETTKHVYVWCESTKNGDTIYEDILSQVPILPKVEERVKDLPANLNPEQYPSVLIFGQDSLSHMNFRRHMPKVHDFLVNRLEAIEFDGLNSLGLSTRDSVMPFCSGESWGGIIRLLNEKNLPGAENPNFIWNDFGEMGYRTSFGEDCASDPLFYVSAIPALEHQPVDYDLRKETRNLEYISVSRHGKAHFGGCYGARLTYDVILENLYRTAYTFARRNKPYWHFSWTVELTHDCNYYSTFGEEYLLKTLENLHSNQLLNNTILILFSDHGMRYGPLRLKTRRGFLEERLPVLYIALPTDFKERYPSAYKNMLINREKLITTYDVHETMHDILNLNEIENINRNGEENGGKRVSLFRRISDRRTCDVININPGFCTCTNRISISVEKLLVKMATEQAINDINTKLTNYSQCHQLQLENITSAYKLDDVVLNDGSKSEEFSNENESNAENVTAFSHEISFKTSPGGGEFYALVVPHFDSLKITEVQRISPHGDDGYCVDIKALKQFCQCKV